MTRRSIELTNQGSICEADLATRPSMQEINTMALRLSESERENAELRMHIERLSQVKEVDGVKAQASPVVEGL